MTSRTLVSAPWSQVCLAVLPGVVLLFIHPFSVPLISQSLTFLGLATLLVVIVSIVVQIVAHKTFLVPVWAFIPLGLLTALGLMATIGSFGFFPTFLMLILLGSILARQNGLSAGLFVLAGAMIAASWAIEQSINEDFGPYRAVLLHESEIMAILILPPILVLRARSMLIQVVALLFPVAAYSALFAFPQSGSMWMNIPAIQCWLFAPALASTVRRSTARPWIYATLIILLAFLLLPIASLSEPTWTVRLPGVVAQLLLLIIFFTPPAALIIAALLLYSGVTLLLEWRNTHQGKDENSLAQHKHVGRMALVALILCVLLLIVTLDNLYWLMVWDNTTDALGFFWLVIPVLAAIGAGIMLVLALPRWTKLTGLIYAVLLPVLIITVATNATSVNFRQLTQERAAQVTQALETYFAREGKYPEDLRQLTPWYILVLPKPVTIYGQDWCYDGGKDYYRLGYVDREHWSSLIWEGQIYKAKGVAPDLPPICDKALTARNER